MKSLNVLALILLFCLNSLNAQDTINTIQKIKLYRTWVYLYSEPYLIKGALYEVNDSTISVSSSLVVQDYSTNNFDILNLNITNIDRIKTRRHGRVGRGVLIGAITGFAVGGLMGLIDGDDPPCSGFCISYSAGTKALMAGIPLAALGMAIGGGVGSAKIKIPIFGSIYFYNRNKNKLREYSIKKR